jgi:hypothetical protein
MGRRHHIIIAIYFIFSLLFPYQDIHAQDLPPRYATLELFTNTPCPICANQNPGLFSRLENYEGQYHLVSFYPGKPYSSCIFYQANITENTLRWQFYTGEVFGTPTVAINGTDFTNSNGVTNTVLDNVTGGTSWLKLTVEETAGSLRTVDITLQDYVGGSLTTGQLFAVVVEKEINYDAPNGETIHYNVFRKFLSATNGDEVDLSSGSVTVSYEYEVDAAWQADQVYVIAWLANSLTKEIYNSGTRFDPDFVSAVNDATDDVNFEIYPNPSSGQFTLKLPANHQDAAVSVFDAAGSSIFKKEYSSASEITVDGSTWPEGSYLVRVMLDGRETSKWVRVVR